MNKRVLARAGKQMDKVAPQYIGLAGDDDLVALKNGLIQAGKLGEEASKREREMEEEKENTAAKRQRYSTMTVIIN